MRRSYVLLRYVFDEIDFMYMDEIVVDVEVVIFERFDRDRESYVVVNDRLVYVDRFRREVRFLIWMRDFLF